MKTTTLLAFVALLIFNGCKSSKPYTGADGGAGSGGEVDYTDVSDLPQRGNFNPDKDLDYNTFRSPEMECGTIYFATDSTTIQPSERSKLEKVSGWMQQNTGRKLLIAGHCDDRGTLEYNRALGERRALAVRDYLAGLGVSTGSLYTHSYGEENPAEQGTSDIAYAKNRRAEIGIVNQ